MVGQNISHYRVIGKLGAGGMGEVWCAHDTRLDRDLALKVLPADRFADQTARARLVREARMASRLNQQTMSSLTAPGVVVGTLAWMPPESLAPLKRMKVKASRAAANAGICGGVRLRRANG